MIDLTKQNLFFTSDHHFWHKNVLKFDKRPFATVEEMNEILIANWNNTVGPNDIVYFLGDFAFAGITKIEAIANRLNGIIYVILGNHDDYRLLSKVNRFASVDQYRKITVLDHTAPDGKQTICLSHYPMFLWDKAHGGSIMLHGHSHHSIAHMDHFQRYKIMDVGVNGVGYNYSPISYDFVKTKLAGREIPSHHDAPVEELLLR